MKELIRMLKKTRRIISRLKKRKKKFKAKTKKINQEIAREWNKWFSSVIILIGMVLTSNQIYPLNLMFSMVGSIGWLVVALIWHDRSIMIINASAIMIMSNGLVQYFINN